MTLRSKQFFHVCSQGLSECYSPVLLKDGLAYLAVEGNRESLVYQPDHSATQTVLAENTYVLSPHAVGNRLVWVQKEGDRWELKAVEVKDGSSKSLEVPHCCGRPRALTSCRCGDISWLMWEERVGQSTNIFAARQTTSGWEKPVQITPEHFNSYDPSACIDSQGRLNVVYCAFHSGQYRVLLQQCDATGQKIGEHVDLTPDAIACVYPSVTPNMKGGVWYSYGTLGEKANHPNSHLQHPRFLNQHRLFQNGEQIYVGLFRDGETFAPLAPPNAGANQGNIAAGVVHGADNACRSRVLTDSTGRLHLLIRQHVEQETPEKQGDELMRRVSDGQTAPRQNHPDLWHLTLNDHMWDEPERVTPRTHLDDTIDVVQNGDTLAVAFTEDGRHTGWNVGGEWFDDNGQLGVGRLVMDLESNQTPDYEIRPLRLPAVPVGSIEDPVLPRQPDDSPYHCAIGQTHCHTNLSVCIRQHDRNIHFNYRFMQDVQHSDFGSTTDHVYNMWQTEMLLTRKLAEYYYFPGTFVSFPAYEWTGSSTDHEDGPWGHMNPLWLEETGDMPFYTPVDPDCEGGSARRMWQAYHGHNVVTPPHHVADNLHAFNWDVYDASFIPVIELFQDLRGSGEQDRAPGVTNFIHNTDDTWALPQLLDGRRFGFIGGGDHSGIARAGLWVEELTRTGIYDAFMNRRTFATTAGPVRVDFSCNGKPQGCVLKTDDAEFQLTVESPMSIHEIQIVRDGDVVDTLENKPGETQTQKWSARRKRDGEFWYCRVLFKNGEIAWSSPVWIEK